MGGGVKGKSIESKESQSLIFPLYKDDRTDQSVSPQRFLSLNYEDLVKIEPILLNPPSETKVVASNLRFTCWNYYDFLQIWSKTKEDMNSDELGSLLNKATNGNIVTMYDIANLYTKELGIKTVPKNDELNLTDSFVNIILQQYYQQEGTFENWIKKTTVWVIVSIPCFFGINQSNLGSVIPTFEKFQLDFTTEGNTLTYDKQK